MCTHDNVKIVPTAENSWGIEDTYDVKCLDCGEVILMGMSMEEIEKIVENNRAGS